MARSKTAETQDQPDNAKLTKSETEILTLLAAGQTPNKVANSRYNSERTVNSHLANIYKKLGVDDLAEAVNLATDKGLINVVEVLGRKSNLTRKRSPETILAEFKSLGSEEKRVANAMTKFQTAEEAANYLEIAKGTVNFHLDNIYEKMGYRNNGAKEVRGSIERSSCSINALRSDLAVLQVCF
jgi:DNA-binding NarL/FixJ family response regulator